MGNDEEEVLERLEDLVQEMDEDSEEPLAPPPLQAFAHRHRLTIGIGVGMVMLAILVWSLVTLPPATVPGFFGVVQTYSFPLMCLFIAAVGFTWGLRLKTLWTNIAAYGAILTYLGYLVLGWVYERFIAG